MTNPDPAIVPVNVESGVADPVALEIVELPSNAISLFLLTED